ncbi:MAG: acyltransferase family protein [Parvibaculaceae bacterium]
MSKIASKARVDWVDCAKGVCIILVVMMHSTLGVEKAAEQLSWLNPFIEWARPFRMPDFFLISGLFLAARINRPWRSYLDSKVMHFAYFYILWMTIQFASKSYGMITADGATATLEAYLLAFIQPFGTLWFIYLLAVFFVVTKLLGGARPQLVFLFAAALEIAPIDTGWLAIDEFAARFVYFYTGYWLARYVFDYAKELGTLHPLTIASGLFAWGFINAFMVTNGYSTLPGFSLVLGFIGAGAVIAFAVFLSKFPISNPIRYCGENSIVIYLSFFLFMAATRTILLKTGIIADLGLVSLIVTATGVIGPLVLFWVTRNSPLYFLFRRPQWARLTWEAPVRRTLAAE